MSYIEGFDRNQLEFSSPDDWIEADSVARVIDAFVDRCVTGKISFYRDENGKDKNMGRPFYRDSDLIKLYIYGYAHKVKSSRMLARECRLNIELRWLVRGLRPDFRTIALFRQMNTEQITEVFHLFNDFIRDEVSDAYGSKLLGGGYFSVDGSKIRANQAKDSCYTASKIDDRITNDKNQIARYKAYLEDMDNADRNEEESKEKEIRMDRKEVEKRISDYEKRLEQHEEIRKKVEETGEQVAMNDPDSRLMKNHYGGFNPSYNIQTAVDSESHLIADFDATNRCTDHGLLASTLEGVKNDDDRDIIEAVADNGYNSEEDLAKCLENGIIPHVFPEKIKDESGNRIPKKSVTISFPYEPDAEITDEVKASVKSEDITKCLHAGVIPDCYSKVLSTGEKLDVKTVNEHEYSNEDPLGIDSMSDEERIALASQGYFVRDIANDKVFCPQGMILRRKSQKKCGDVRYCNKLACKNCNCQCFNASRTTRWKEVDFSQNCRIKGPGVGVNRGRKIGQKKRVYLTFTPDMTKLDNRKCLSEHPFGTIKRYRLGDHFLLKGLNKVKAEAALLLLGYNLKRLLTLVPSSVILGIGRA